MEAEDVVDEVSIRKQTAEHLLKIGNHLSSTCPAASRYYMFNAGRRYHEISNLLRNSKKLPYQFCHYCGSIWTSDNCKIRVQKRPSINSHLKKLLKLEANQPWKLNTQQKKKLRKFRESTNKLVYSCFACKKKTVYPGSKKCDSKCRSLAQPSSSTPLPKIKLKKGNLNAGLFIPSPCSIDTNDCDRNNLQKSAISKNVKQIGTQMDNGNGSLSNLQKSEISKYVKQIGTQMDKGNGSLSNNESLRTSMNKSKTLNTSRTENRTTPKAYRAVPPNSVSSTEKQSTSKKRKKTLLSQILSEEQNKKKKPSLSSFLVSL